MKNFIKYSFYVTAFTLAIFSASATPVTHAQIATACPAGYTCTPVAPQPTGCPVGYTCTPTNSTSGPTGIGYAGISGGAQAQTCPSLLTYLSIGSSGSNVVTLQSFLISNGFDIPSVSAGRTQKGYFGSQTAAALSQYQGRMGLPVTGVLDATTQAQISSGECMQYKLPVSYNQSNPNMAGGLCPTGQVWSGSGCALPLPPQSQSSIQVISPNGGQTIRQGQTVAIQWSTQNIPANATMNINLSNSNGVVGQIITGLNPNTNQSYSWNTGSPIGTASTISGQVPEYIYPGQYKVDLEVYIPTAVTADNQKGMYVATDLSDTYFTVTDSSGNLPVAPSVSSVNPSSIPGDGVTTATIYGSGFNTSTAVYFSTSVQRNAYKTIPTSVSSSGQSLTFVLPANFPPSGQYQMTVSNDGIAMSNPLNFTVTVAAPTTNPVSSMGMMTYQGSGFSFQYPATLNSGYSSIGITPEAIVTTNGANIDSNGCYKTIAASGAPGTDSQITVNNVPLCQSNDLSPGAGTLSGHYYFTTNHNGEYVTIGYQIGVPNGCGALLGSSGYQNCENFENNYNSIVIQPLQQSAGTLIFTN